MSKKKTKPIVGITPDRKDINNRRAYFTYKAYVDAIEESNGIPIILTYTGNAKALIEQIDGLLITGGNFDIPPEMYGEKPILPLKTIKERTLFESNIYIEALKKGIPVLGVCGGMQLINVIAGGSLYQDIKTQIKTNIDHGNGTHQVNIKPRSILHKILRQSRLTTNTSHHQAIKKPGKGVIVSARAVDGIIEAIELKEFPDVIGVQWHPERMQENVNLIYRWLVTSAQKKL
ncbi:MAG: gamma-glutamyl-gamma-aminobutyrate hydrolase family protein [bacterium]